MPEKPEVREFIYVDRVRRSLREAEHRAEEIARRGYDCKLPPERYHEIAEQAGKLADQLRPVTDV